ncbi:hypothetical protein [Pseudohalocynthiibacter sp. F2068]|uniref:hypothetical protein n=1 Tax=Pseudohalocynthiibacter sp. F2068 TaxID=2926418 RepID=UPI001FF6435D|nr:hypothetical protein [Pseudohalocynthiibacter sp. F2068]MCK0101977.1 hypothetical protein [Pseudohalocynthiibacter sp. F2068]
MTPMTADQDQNPTKKVSAVLQWARKSWLIQFVIWARWFLSIGLTLLALLWSAYVLGQDISNNLSYDYKALQETQKTLLQDAQEFRDALLNPNVDVAMEDELKELRETAIETIASLGGMRTPSNRIEVAKLAYRDALQELIAVSNRLARGDHAGMAIPLHNALQSVANEGGNLNDEISYFQGGMWPQLKAAIF